MPRNNFKALNSNDQNADVTSVLSFCIWILDLFRISDFVLRIWFRLRSIGIVNQSHNAVAATKKRLEEKRVRNDAKLSERIVLIPSPITFRLVQHTSTARGCDNLRLYFAGSVFTKVTACRIQRRKSSSSSTYPFTGCWVGVIGFGWWRWSDGELE